MWLSVWLTVADQNKTTSLSEWDILSKAIKFGSLDPRNNLEFIES